MPTLLNRNGFKFFFYANEHLPKHVHIMKGDEFAKIELETSIVVLNYFKPKDLKFVLSVINENRELFEGIWDEWFN